MAETQVCPKEHHIYRITSMACTVWMITTFGLNQRVNARMIHAKIKVVKGKREEVKKERKLIILTKPIILPSTGSNSNA